MRLEQLNSILGKIPAENRQFGVAARTKTPKATTPKKKTATVDTLEKLERASNKSTAAVRVRRYKVDYQGKPVRSVSLLSGKNDKRLFSSISTVVSENNIVEPLFPDSLVKPGSKDAKNYNDELFRVLREASKYIFVEGYDINREDIVQLLIDKAKQGVQVAVLFDPVNTPAEEPKRKLLDKLIAAKLANLQVVEYPILEGKKDETNVTAHSHCAEENCGEDTAPSFAAGKFSQILHAKKVICDTPDGSICEVSGGINFNENSVKHFDTAWYTSGVAVLDSLMHILEHYALAAGELPFDVDKFLPTAEQVNALTTKRLNGAASLPTTIEMAASGTSRFTPRPRGYSLKVFKKYIENNPGKQVVIDSHNLLDEGAFALLQKAVEKQAPVTVLINPMTVEQEEEFRLMKPKLKAMGVELVKVGDLRVDDTYLRLVCRELDEAIAKKESIDAGAFALTSEEVIVRLIAAHKAGCRVRVLLDDLTIKKAMINLKALERLTVVGVPVKGVEKKTKERLAGAAGTTPNDLKLHAKAILIGRGTPNARELAGSANFSGVGFDYNLEDGRLVRSPSVVDAVGTRLFDFLWKEAVQAQPRKLVDDAKRIDWVTRVPIDTKLEDLVFVVSDNEVTGLSARNGSRIINSCDIAFKVNPKTGEYKIVDILNQYIIPGEDHFGNKLEIPSITTNITGIDEAWLAKYKAVGETEAVQKRIAFRQKIGQQGPVLEGGQGYDFDITQQDYTLRLEHNGQKTENGVVNYKCNPLWFDTIVLAEKLDPDEKENNLRALIKRENVEIENPTEEQVLHKAIGCGTYTMMVFCKQLARGKFQTVRDLLGKDEISSFKPNTVVTNTKGAPVLQLDYEEGALVARLPKGQTWSENYNVRTKVLGRDGHRLKVQFTVADGTSREVIGFVDVEKDEVVWKYPGAIYFELLEAGLNMARPNVIKSV